MPWKAIMRLKIVNIRQHILTILLHIFSTGSVPVDPKTGDPYVGNPFGVDGYTICTDLEKDGTGADDGDEDICDF